jgi:hypothetical protein
MASQVAAPRLGEETIPPGEDADISKIVQLNASVLNTKARPVRRGQHPKHHGCVRAEFRVEPGLPSDVAHGIFREPRTFAALVRFSNGESNDDRKPDAHGMAIKLLGVEGPKLLDPAGIATTQDFILVDHRVFFIRNAAEYVRFSDAFVKSRSHNALLMIGGLLLRYFWRRWHELGILMKFRAHTPGNPLRTTYWSTTPYRLGTGAVKYTASPQGAEAKGPVSVPDGLREAMSAQLVSGDANFDFMVQRQIDTIATPLENPTVDWKESISPNIKVATLHIPPQSFTSSQQMEACENLSFNVWHSLPNHQPLGSINRVRKSVYVTISKMRHELNGVPEAEPTKEWAESLWPLGSTATEKTRRSD